MSDAGFETEIAICNDADEQFVFIHDRNAADLETAHYRQSVRHEGVLIYRHRIDDHAGFTAFNFINLFGLLLNRKIFMDHADTAGLR